MRQIKFRVWNGERMLYPEFFGTDAFGSKGSITIGWSNQPYVDLGSIRKAPYEAREGCTLMQFTGLIDCEDKEIWENDLLSNNFGTDKEVVRQVIFQNGSWIMKRIKGKSRLGEDILLGEYRVLNFKVIGNIYEHPNLLNNE